MKKDTLIRKTNEAINETKEALQTVYDELNQGQQKKIMKKENIVKLFERYCINIQEGKDEIY